MQLFVDPGEEADGGVSEGITQRLWLRVLFLSVTSSLFQEPFRAVCGGLFTGAVGRELVLEIEYRIGEQDWLVAEDHIDVDRLDVIRVEERHDPGDHTTPVAALGNVAGIAEFEHEFVACFGVLGEGEAAFCHAG